MPAPASFEYVVVSKPGSAAPPVSWRLLVSSSMWFSASSSLSNMAAMSLLLALDVEVRQHLGGDVARRQVAVGVLRRVQADDQRHERVVVGLLLRRDVDLDL